MFDSIVFLCILCLLLIVFVLFLCRLIIGKDVCRLLGHDWEHIDHESVWMDNGDVEEWNIYKCNICGAIKKIHNTQKQDDF